MKNPNRTVRITGGRYRGRIIRTPGNKTHPMGERERIALFNMITDWVRESSVADLYCGGGTLGIEALSRGAKSVVFIDRDAQAIATIIDNLKQLDIYKTIEPRSQESYSVLRADIVALTETITSQYGAVIADPPYDQYTEKMIERLPKLVLDGGILVLSHPNEPPELDKMELMKTRKYAAAHISVYVKK